jgi:SAM-dependent methyltransferase
MDPTLYQLHESLEDRYWWFVAKNSILMHVARRLVPPSRQRRAADIGCGTGGLLARLHEHYDSCGVEMQATARDACARRGLTAHPGSLPDDIPLPPHAFDLVIATEVLEHVERDTEAAKSLARLLKPGGVLLVTVPAHQWMWTVHDEMNHHFRRYSKTGLRRVIEGADLHISWLSFQMVALFPVMAAGRLASRARGKRKDANIRLLPEVINTPLRWMFEAEKWVLPLVPSPVGSSLICAAKRPATPEGAGASERPRPA